MQTLYSVNIDDSGGYDYVVVIEQSENSKTTIVPADEEDLLWDGKFNNLGYQSGMYRIHSLAYAIQYFKERVA